MIDRVFDYEAATKLMNIPEDIMKTYEAQARQEFPNDAMLMELHVLRALKSYASKSHLEYKR